MSIWYGPHVAPKAMGLSLPSMKSKQRQVSSFDRRYLIQKFTWTSILWSQTVDKASAKVMVKPDTAFRTLVQSREELEYVKKTFLVNKDYDGMRDYLSDSSLNVNNYEENATALLTSKQLDAESKMAMNNMEVWSGG